MAEEKTDPGTKPFPGSPTGNVSGAGGKSAPPAKPEEEKPKPSAAYPGSPTGNASGAGAGRGQGTASDKKPSGQ